MKEWYKRRNFIAQILGLNLNSTDKKFNSTIVNSNKEIQLKRYLIQDREIRSGDIPKWIRPQILRLDSNRRGSRELRNMRSGSCKTGTGEGVRSAVEAWEGREKLGEGVGSEVVTWEMAEWRSHGWENGDRGLNLDDTTNGQMGGSAV
jgi:hypothetical protein